MPRRTADTRQLVESSALVIFGQRTPAELANARETAAQLARKMWPDEPDLAEQEILSMLGLDDVG